MAEAKSKKTPNKFFDVAKPGKTAPSSTSRPVIITNRPVLKDPMVIRVDTGDDETPDSGIPAETTEMKHKVDIKPLHIDLESVLAPGAPEVKKSSKKTDTKAAEEKSEDMPPEKEATTPTVDEEKPAVEAGKNDATEAAVDDTAEAAATEEAAPEAAPAKEEKTTEAPARVGEKVIAPPEHEAATAETAPESPAEEAPTKTEDEDTDGTDSETSPLGTGDDSEPSLDNNDKPVLSEKEAKAAEAAKKIAEEQEKIIASGAYYLPINAVEKRRSRRNIILGTILLLSLLVLAALAAWDAGLFSIPGMHAPTNYL